LTKMDMLEHIRVGKMPLISFYFKTLWARHIFASASSKILTLAMARLSNFFTRIYQKSDRRRMDEFYEYAT